MNENELKNRCRNFFNELSIPITAFCRKIELCTQSYYMWQKDTLSLSISTLERIDKYLKKYNF